MSAAIAQEMARRPFTFADLRIETKDSEVISFIPNSVQERYLDIIVPDWRRGEYHMTGRREILLKARQFGFSTLIAALFFLDTVNNSNRHTVVIAYDTAGTEKLFRMVDRFYNNLDPDRRPKTRFANTRILYWPSLDSSYEVMTAGSKTSGRGATIHNLHMSEAAFWEYPEVVTGLLQAVPARGNVFMETTANGEGNLFYEEYQAAKGGRSSFEDRFFAWWMHDEYRREPPEDFQRVTRETQPALFERFGDEQALADAYELDDAQLCWRRYKISEPGMGALFAQEYPANDQECFRVSGSKFFTEWDLDAHTCLPQTVPTHWKWVAGLDWGYGAPFCFLLGAIDERGDVWIVDEVYGARLTNAEQTDRVNACLSKWGVDGKKILIATDPAMWQKKQRQDDSIGKADVEDYWKAGINCSKANNNRRHGWSNFRQYLHDRAIHVFRGNCPNLIRTIGIMIHDKEDPEDLDTTLEDHAVDTARYLLNTRVRASIDPHAAPTPKKADHRPAFMKKREFYA